MKRLIASFIGLCLILTAATGATFLIIDMIEAHKLTINTTTTYGAIVEAKDYRSFSRRTGYSSTRSYVIRYNDVTFHQYSDDIYNVGDIVPVTINNTDDNFSRIGPQQSFYAYVKAKYGIILLLLAFGFIYLAWKGLILFVYGVSGKVLSH